MSVTVLTVLLLAVPAVASTPWRDKLVKHRTAANTLRESKCIPRIVYPVKARHVAAWNLRKFARQARSDWVAAMFMGQHCRPTEPRAIIRWVFPDATEEAAIRVAGCETGWTFWPRARNPSGASGLFQLMPFHWRGKFDPFDPWENTQYALRLSRGGADWGPWVCKP